MRCFALIVPICILPGRTGHVQASTREAVAAAEQARTEQTEGVNVSTEAVVHVSKKMDAEEDLIRKVCWRLLPDVVLVTVNIYKEL